MTPETSDTKVDVRCWMAPSGHLQMAKVELSSTLAIWLALTSNRQGDAASRPGFSPVHPAHRHPEMWALPHVPAARRDGISGPV